MAAMAMVDITWRSDHKTIADIKLFYLSFSQLLLSFHFKEAHILKLTKTKETVVILNNESNEHDLCCLENSLYFQVNVEFSFIYFHLSIAISPN